MLLRQLCGAAVLQLLLLLLLSPSAAARGTRSSTVAEGQMQTLLAANTAYDLPTSNQPAGSYWRGSFRAGLSPPGTLVDLFFRGVFSNGQPTFQTYFDQPPDLNPGSIQGVPKWKKWFPSSIQGHLNIPARVLLVPVLLGFSLLLLVAFSMSDCTSRTKTPRIPTEMMTETKMRPWSTAGIVALTSYRFYTGFLSATWMPYLLALEGHQLMEEQQSFFMGSAKLIYGMSILLNPMFGLVGDQMASVSHWSGRRLFVHVGVGVGGLGIYVCLVAAKISSVRWYFVGTVLWMLGEAMADVTTETLVPELLPQSQYKISSNIRALNFLLGGLAGYGALIVFRNWHYSWLYYGYLIVMIVAAFLTLTFIGSSDLQPTSEPKWRRGESLTALIGRAYYKPSCIEGGFPRACLCQLVFSLGSAPMFFLLLMVRDIVGIRYQVMVQMHFSVMSIVFFVSAAFASALDAVIAPGPTPREVEQADAVVVAGPEAGAGASDLVTSRRTSLEAVRHRWRLMVLSTILFGLFAGILPAVGLLPTLDQRITAFYILAVFWGMSFGSVYARFQECTWSLLPPGVDMANAMGFAAMCKLLGVGIGNFIAGLALTSFYSAETGSYSLSGYAITCLICSGVVMLSAYLAHGLSKVAETTHLARL